MLVFLRLRVEIDEVLGLRKDITHDDLPKLNYTSCVYKETLRLWPAIPEIARGVDADLNIEGYQIPQNTWVQVIFKNFDLIFMFFLLFFV